MKYAPRIGFAPVAAALALLVARPGHSQHVDVPAQCNIYGAGHATVRANCMSRIGPGILPMMVNLPAGSICVECQNVTGTVLYCPACTPANGPDGNASGSVAFDSLDGLSQITASRVRFFEGVFLTDEEPADPPPPGLTFTDFSFPQLSPSTRQIFFIGDGLTGTGTGSVQHFSVPADATRLFLGFGDGFRPCIGAYDDNSGSISADVIVSGLATQPQPTTTCPAGTANFAVTTQGNGPFTFQWQIETTPGVWNTLGKDPLPLPCASRASASATNPFSSQISIAVNPCPGIHSYHVRCVVTNPCGSATSNPAALTICCAGDIVPNGAVDIDDLLAVINAWGPCANPDNCPADIAPSGGDDVVNIDDLLAVINGWGPCP